MSSSNEGATTATTSLALSAMIVFTWPAYACAKTVAPSDVRSPAIHSLAVPETSGGRSPDVPGTCRSSSPENVPHTTTRSSTTRAPDTT